MFFNQPLPPLKRLTQSNKQFLCLLFFLSVPVLVRGQGIFDGLVSARDWIIDIVNVIFAIVVVLGLIRVIAKFIKGDPDVASAALGLVLAVAIWGGFVYLQDDIFGFFGSEGTTITNDTGNGAN